MAKFGVPTEEQLVKINKLAKRTLSSDEVFVFSGKSAGDMMIPGRFMKLSPEILKVMADDAKKGVSFMLNHNWSNWGGIQAVPYGKVFDGVIRESTEEGETVALSLIKYIVRDSEVVDGVSADALIKKIETGILSDTSIGWGTDTMICSICAKNYYSSECRHWRGVKYEMGDGTQKTCTVTAMPPSVIIPYNNNALFEESIVWDGAYPGAVVAQAKHGDIIETPTGNFAIIQDKEELPDGTLFHGYYHNGDIVTMVKKSEHKKVYSISNTGSEAEKKGGVSTMFKELLTTLSKLGVSVEEDKDYTLAEIGGLIEAWNQKLQEDLTAAQAAAKPLVGTSEAFMTVEQAKEKLGKEMTADTVLKLAVEGQIYHKKVSDDALAMGVRAMGNDFPSETWKNTFATMETSAIIDIMRTWETQANNIIPTGRRSDPKAGHQTQATDVPDEAFQVR